MSERNDYGQGTLALVQQLEQEGIDRAAVFMRHSARTFDRSINDLANPLTDHGRALSTALGEQLPRRYRLRGYASPPERCMETAQLIIAGHESQGGVGMRTREVEAFGVFYVLDQKKMWMGLQGMDGGLADYVGAWFAGDIAEDVIMPGPLAVQSILRVLAARLREPTDVPHLEICVSHDMSVYTVRHGVGLERVSEHGVEFLDGLVLFERGTDLVMRSQHGGEVVVTHLL